MRPFILKLIRKYKKLYKLDNWDIDLEISPHLNTTILNKKNCGYALLIINKQESQSPKEIEDIVIRELGKLKEHNG